MTLFLASLAGKAQQYQEIDLYKTVLINATDTTGIVLGSSTADCIKALGRPDNISDYYSEIDEDTMQLFTYGKSSLYFLKDKLDSFNIRDKSVRMGHINGPMYKIGDRRGDNKALGQFPITHHQSGVSKNIRYTSASVMQLQINGKGMDTLVEFLFDASDRLLSFSITN